VNGEIAERLKPLPERRIEYFVSAARLRIDDDQRLRDGFLPSDDGAAPGSPRGDLNPSGAVGQAVDHDRIDAAAGIHAWMSKVPERSRTRRQRQVSV
jgi:hypothetical protein